MPSKVDSNALPDFTTALPTRSYSCIITEVKQDASKKFAPQDMFVCEIVAPDRVEFAGAEVLAAGRTFDFYVTYSPKNLANTKKTLGKLGFNVTGELTVPSEDEVRAGSYTRIPEIQDTTQTFKGLVFDMILSTEPVYKTDNNKWNGVRVKDDEGNDIITGYRIAMPSGDSITSPLRTASGENPF